MAFVPYHGFIFKWLLFQWYCLCSFAKFRGFWFLFPPNLIMSHVVMNAVTGGLHPCLGHAAIPSCTSGARRRKREMWGWAGNFSRGQALPDLSAHHWPLRQPRVAQKTGLWLGRDPHPCHWKWGGTQGLNGCGVKQVVRMDKIRPKILISLLLLPEWWLPGCCETGLVNQKLNLGNLVPYVQ